MQPAKGGMGVLLLKDSLPIQIELMAKTSPGSPVERLE